MNRTISKIAALALGCFAADHVAAATYLDWTYVPNVVGGAYAISLNADAFPDLTTEGLSLRFLKDHGDNLSSGVDGLACARMAYEIGSEWSIARSPAHRARTPMILQ